MCYQLAMLPALHSVEKQQNVDEWKTASMQAQEHGRSLHRGLENGSLLVGSRRCGDRVGLGTKHKSSKKKTKTDAGYIHDVRERALDVR